jgi:hypothetical protein
MTLGKQQAAWAYSMEEFNTQHLRDEARRASSHVNASNRRKALENTEMIAVSNKLDISIAWEIIRSKVNISAE